MASPTPDIPQFKTGDPILAAPLESIRQQVQRTRISVSPPLSLQETPSGVCISLGSLVGAVEGLVTAQITAMSGATPGHGLVTLQRFDGTSFTPGQTGVKVFNKTDRVVLVGAYVTLIRLYNQWFVIAVDKCSNLS